MLVAGGHAFGAYLSDAEIYSSREGIRGRPCSLKQAEQLEDDDDNDDDPDDIKDVSVHIRTSTYQGNANSSILFLKAANAPNLPAE